MLGCLGCRRFLHEDAAVCPFCGTARASGPAPSVLAVALGVMLAACGPSAGDDDGAGDDTSTGSTTQGTTATTTASTTASTTVGTSVGTTMSDESTTALDTGSTADTQDVTDDEGAAFYGGPRPDGGVPLECNSWAQDCPEGEKCMPWANDGGNSWNALKCTPLADNAGAPGDPCTVEGSGVSGIDDCELGAMCWAVDPETNMGRCVAMCTGSPDAPICEDLETACAIANDGVLHLCLPTCDPLAPMCPEGEACFPVGDVYVCSPE